MRDAIEALQPVVAALLHADTVDAVVRDGWPRPMVEAGFARHSKTWDLDLLAASLRRELAELPDATPPRTMTHVWPALPGAGVTPLLAAALLGVEVQRIRPSSRGRNFAERVVDAWPGLELTDDVEAQRIVVSGSDETVAAIIAQYGDRVVGYGDRQSFAVVFEDEAESTVDGVAEDVVMWLGLGCFSAHAVLFVGSHGGAERYGSLLATAIARCEQAWNPSPSEGQLATRVQEIAIAEFETRVWPANLGWVEQRDRWDGRPRPANVVALCRCDDPFAALAIRPMHRQGVAFHGPASGVTAATFGATRLCAPGELQTPPADWPHDGVSNAAALLGFRSGRIGL